MYSRRVLAAAIMVAVARGETGERELQLNIIVVTVTVLVIISLTFETLKEVLLERTSENMLPIMNSLFGELTLLGFIGLSLYLVFQTKCIMSLLERTFPNDEKGIEERGEQVHMALFMIMVIFLAQAVAMARMGEATQRKWKAWEVRKGLLLSTRTCASAKRFLDASYLALLVQPYFAPRLRSLIFSMTRIQFVRGYDLAAETEFDFANYLGIALGRTFAELVEVPIKTWLGLEVCLIVFFFLDGMMSPSIRIVLWISLGYVVLTMAFVVHAKMRLVLRHHVRDKVEKLLDAYAAGRISDAVEDELFEAKTPLQRKTVKKTPTYAVKPPPSVGGHIELAEATPPLVEDDDVDDEDDARAPLVAAASPPREHRPFHEWLDRFYSAVRVAYDALRVAVAHLWDWTIVAWRWSAATLACVVEGVVEVVHWVRVEIKVALFGGDPRELVAASQELRSTFHRSLDDYAKQFWFGTTHKAHFTLDVIRCIPLFMSIYIAVFATVYLPGLYEKGPLPVAAHVRNVLVILLSIVPPVALQIKLPYVVEDFVVTANVSAFHNLRFIEQVLTRQKTVAAFQGLRVVACLQHPDTLAKILGERSDVRAPSAHLATLEEQLRQASANLDHDLEDELVEKIEEQHAIERRSRRSWANVFQLFDKDHRGTIDRDEMRLMLTKFALRPGQETHIDAVIEALDSDASGEISFDEFYDFGKLLEDHLVRTVDHHQLVDDIFTMIDKDGGGLITVEELHSTMEDIGLDLSMNVVYVSVSFVALSPPQNMIKDIDEDGNGALDVHEFKQLLERMNTDFGVRSLLVSFQPMRRRTTRRLRAP